MVYVFIGYNRNARSRIPCRRARKFILKRGKLILLRHRKIRMAGEAGHPLFADLSFPLHKYWICRNVLRRITME